MIRHLRQAAWHGWQPTLEMQDDGQSESGEDESEEEERRTTRTSRASAAAAKGGVRADAGEEAPMASANAWSAEEDAELKQLVSRDGEGRWPTKAKSFSTERNAPALRLRWLVLKEQMDALEELSEEELGGAAKRS